MIRESTLTLLLDFGFIDEHDRDVIAHRVNAMALDALQTAAVFFEYHLAFTEWTNKNVQQFLADWHGKLTVYQ